MMYSIEVYGAFDFLKEAVKVGVLEYERIKGNASYRFMYEDAFLKQFPAIRLSADLGLFPGLQSAREGIFSCFGDALPDRWGRALIDKRERMQASKAHKIPRQFDDFGYLVRIDDATRMGAFQFIYNGERLGIQNAHEPVPPVSSLDAFIREAHEIEKAEKQGESALHEEWLDNVWKQGSSLGGARPKANIVEEEALWIAKIPSIKDDYDVGMWEYFATMLAAQCGIRVPETRVMRIGPTPYHTFFSKRFDRNGEKRTHFASSLTLTGFHDGDNAETNKGYIDIADAIVGDAGVRNPADNLAELYRRVAFNIIIGNHDDHFRNHGFLLRKDGWELSPAYDMNPTNALTQSLMISPVSNRSSLADLLAASDSYLLDRADAKDILREVVQAAAGWRKQAKAVGIQESEQERFARRFEHSLAEGQQLPS